MLGLSRLLSIFSAHSLKNLKRKPLSQISFRNLNISASSKDWKHRENAETQRHKKAFGFSFESQLKNNLGFEKVPVFIGKNKQSEIIEEVTPSSIDDGELTETRFASISNLPPYLKEILDKKFSFEYATKIQEEIFNLIPIKKNIKALANIGSGKTLAYLLPCIEIMQRSLSPEETLKEKQVSILILAPTNESVLQITDEAKKLLLAQTYNVLPFVGGTSQKEELDQINTKQYDIVVSTPRRAVNLILSSSAFRGKLKELKVLVLDEADELMNQGFAQNILTILKNVPSTRQTMVFSSTMSLELENLVTKTEFWDFDNIIEINSCKLSSNQQLARRQHWIDQKVVFMAYGLQLHRLFGIIHQFSHLKTVLFLPTVLHVQIFADIFKATGVSVLEMHPLIDKKERVEIVNEFRASKGCLLVTTDVSGRCLDYPAVDLVLQWGAPNSVDSYIQRVCLAERDDRPGKSILIMTPQEELFLRCLEDNNIPFELLDTESEFLESSLDKIYRLNHLCSKINPNLIKKLYLTSFSHFLTQCQFLGTSREQAQAQAKNFILGLGHQPPNMALKNFQADIRFALTPIS